MEKIILPSTIEAASVAGTDNKARVTVSPCFPGYGTTLGNALRRVLLSSLPGAAVSAMKIKGVDHEFSTLAGLKEDVVEVILNVKTLRFRLHSDEPVELELKKTGEGVITAGDFAKNAEVEVVDPKAVIGTLTDASAEFNMKVIVQRGRGYVPVEEREEEKLDIGYIAIDSIYTPVKNVNYSTELVRVGDMTNFDKLLLDITTDGTIAPEEAFAQAAQILVDQFSALKDGFGSSEQMELVEEATKEVEDEEGEESEEAAE